MIREIAYGQMKNIVWGMLILLGVSFLIGSAEATELQTDYNRIPPDTPTDQNNVENPEMTAISEENYRVPVKIFRKNNSFRKGNKRHRQIFQNGPSFRCRKILPANKIHPLNTTGA